MTLSQTVIDNKNQHSNTLLNLYKLDLDTTSSPPIVLRYVENNEDVTFDGETYSKFPITMRHIDRSSGLEITRPELVVSNISEVFSGYLDDGIEFRGKTVTVYRVFYETIDEGEAVSESEFTIDSFKINSTQVIITLTTIIDMLGLTIPVKRFDRNLFPSIPRQRLFIR